MVTALRQIKVNPSPGCITFNDAKGSVYWVPTEFASALMSRMLHDLYGANVFANRPLVSLSSSIN